MHRTAPHRIIAILAATLIVLPSHADLGELDPEYWDDFDNQDRYGQEITFQSNMAFDYFGEPEIIRITGRTIRHDSDRADLENLITDLQKQLNAAVKSSKGSWRGFVEWVGEKINDAADSYRTPCSLDVTAQNAPNPSVLNAPVNSDEQSAAANRIRENYLTHNAPLDLKDNTRAMIVYRDGSAQMWGFSMSSVNMIPTSYVSRPDASARPDCKK